MKKRWGKLLALALGASMVFNLAACGAKTEEKTSRLRQAQPVRQLLPPRLQALHLRQVMQRQAR